MSAGGPRFTRAQVTRRRWVAGGLAIVLAAGGAFFLLRERHAPDVAVEGTSPRVFDTNDPLERACGLPKRYIERIYRGWVPGRSEDVTIVPNEPNYVGTFSNFSHSGPWDYLQEIPLVLYGPGRIAPAGSVARPVTLADVYPTMQELLPDAVVPERAGAPLHEALATNTTKSSTKLVLTIVWDGVGNNTLEVWGERAPTLARMMEEGTSYENATLGSSPSITPATHATLSTGVFPIEHGIPSIHYRTDSGKVIGTFERQDPSQMETTTFADEFDKALGNEPKVGLMAYNTWHIAMAGHGLGTDGGDADLLGIINYRKGGQMVTNFDYFSLPDYLIEFPGLEEHVDELDRSDGKADGEWYGQDILGKHENPAWTNFQLDAMLAELETEGFGEDAMPDLFYANFKQTDLAGHRWSIDHPAMGDTLEAQDRALAELIAWMDENVRDYVVVLTSDHGHTRSPGETGAWPIGQGNMLSAVDRHFEIPDGSSLFETGSAYGLYLDLDVADEFAVTAEDVSRFLNSYTVADNWPEDELPEGYLERGEEQVLAAAFPTAALPEIARCAGLDPETLGG